MLVEWRGGGLLRLACRCGRHHRRLRHHLRHFQSEAPQEKGSASLPFNNIGAISFNGDYVLVGQAQASTGRGAQVALIDVNNLASPKVYGTTFDTITDVTLFGSTAVICGLWVYSNAFQVAKTSDFRPGHDGGRDRGERLDRIRHSVHV
jgi:hypothetical protein